MTIEVGQRVRLSKEKWPLLQQSSKEFSVCGEQSLVFKVVGVHPTYGTLVLDAYGHNYVSSSPSDVELVEDNLDGIYVGDFCRVKAEVWNEWCLRTQRDNEVPSPQPAIDVRTSGPYTGYIMLAFPFYWWKAEELEKVDA